ncbi:hypothetical protein RYA05_05445 [Pseudomonas syringae pv. actinidiae]|nr:hypothetical protein [Pseudomonas syringae pv. actinidiae]
MTVHKFSATSDETEIAFFTDILPQIHVGLEAQQKGSSEILVGRTSDSTQLAAFVTTLKATGFAVAKDEAESGYKLIAPPQSSIDRFLRTYRRVLNNMSTPAMEFA